MKLRKRCKPNTIVAKIECRVHILQEYIADDSPYYRSWEFMTMVQKERRGANQDCLTHQNHQHKCPSQKIRD